MPFTMPKNWQNHVDTGAPEPRTVYYEGQLYVNVRDLRQILNFRQKKVNDNRYAVAMIWMRDLLKGLLADQEGHQDD